MNTGRYFFHDRLRKILLVLGGVFFVLLALEYLYARFKVPEFHSTLVTFVIFLGALVLVWRITKEAYNMFRIAERISDMSDDGVVVTDRQNKIVYANPSVLNTYGYSMEELRGRTPNVFKSGVHDDAFYREMWRSIHDKGAWSGEIWDVKKNGDHLLKTLHIDTIKDKKGNTLYHLAVHSDITEMKALEAERDLLANYDQETKLPNKRYLLRRMKALIAEEIPFQMVLMKVRNSVYLNDRYTKEEYTESFNELRKRLNADNDEIFYAQIDTEFFAFLTHKNVETQDDFDHHVRSFVDLCEKPFSSGMRFKITAGALRFPKDGHGAEDLYNKAMVTFEISAAEQERYLLYKHDYHKTLSREHVLRDALYEALKNNEFSVRYQPIVELASDKIVGCEALLRWKSATLGEVSPEEFLPVAEKYGYVHEIGTFVIEQSLQDKQTFDKESQTPLYMSVNASVSQFGEQGLKSSLLKAIETYNHRAQDVCVEITESRFVEDYDVLNKDLRDLRRAGVHVSIDDFGTGYSSLKRLQEMEVDTLKIDQSFLKGYPEKNDGDLLKAMVQIGKSFAFRVVVEGVETKAQHEFLVQNGCDRAQGYYYAKPLLKETFLEQIKNS